MSTNYELIADLEREPSFLAKTFRDLPVVPIVILSVIIFAAIFAPLLSPHDPEYA